MTPWTSTPPTKPGLYWLRSPARGEYGPSDFVVQVTSNRRGLMTRGFGADGGRFETLPMKGHAQSLPGDLWAPAVPPLETS